MSREDQETYRFGEGSTSSDTLGLGGLLETQVHLDDSKGRRCELGRWPGRL